MINWSHSLWYNALQIPRIPSCSIQSQIFTLNICYGMWLMSDSTWLSRLPHCVQYLLFISSVTTINKMREQFPSMFVICSVARWAHHITGCHFRLLDFCHEDHVSVSSVSGFSKRVWCLMPCQLGVFSARSHNIILLIALQFPLMKASLFLSLLNSLTASEPLELMRQTLLDCCWYDLTDALWLVFYSL